MPEPSIRLLVLKTQNLNAVCRFYRSPGLPLSEEQHGSGPLHFAARLGDTVFEIYPLSESQTTDTTTRLGFSVADPNEAVSNVENVGGRVVKEPFESAWGYMAIVTDPDGRTVELYRD